MFSMHCIACRSYFIEMRASRKKGQGNSDGKDTQVGGSWLTDAEPLKKQPFLGLPNHTINFFNQKRRFFNKQNYPTFFFGQLLLYLFIYLFSLKNDIFMFIFAASNSSENG